MKKILLFATAIATLASCADESFVGDESVKEANERQGAIVFASITPAVTRATGADAAALLNKNFVVEGIKTVGSTKSEVFDNYNVNYTENTADKTASNTANWEYVNQTIISGGKTGVSEQSIKYWDFAASQYDFWAYSLGGGSATVSTLAHDATLGTSAYTIEGDKTALSKVYISDLQTLYASSENVTGKPVMGSEVELSFRSLMTKVRVGLYETIPGYSVREVQFYPSDDGTTIGTATLYASSAVLPSFPTSGTSTYTVTFPTTGKSNASDADYNKAHVTFASDGTKASKVEFGSLTYGAKHKNEKSTGDIWLRINSATPTWAVENGAAAGAYSIVPPFETGAVLTLKVDYTLESTDGTGEPITVHGATALIPSQYTQWKPNYAYTYLFKISDNTNGKTNTSVDKVGLYPITLDAVVVGSQDGTQETITTVATPSITTYSITSNVTSNNEYTTSDDIYVTASTDGTFIDVSGKATLYTITKNSANYVATEAEVLAALNKYSSKEGASAPYTYTGRNDILLTPVTGGLDLTKTEIPLVDGNKISGLTAGQIALIDKLKLSAGTYAFVYETTTGTPTTTNKYEAITPASGTDVTKYYTDNTGAILATGTADGSTTYYDKYTETTNTYAIKVIKVVAAP